MSKNVIINGVTYSGVPYVNIPLASGSGNAKFVDTDSGDAAANEIREGKKAWVDGEEVVGTAPVVTGGWFYGPTVTIEPGIIMEELEITMANAILQADVSLSGGVLGTSETEYPVTANGTGSTLAPGYTSTAYAPATDSETKYVQVEEKAVTPSASVQTILPSSGKLLKKVTVSAVDVSATATESDVLAGKTFFSGTLTRRTGTATVPTVSQDTTTKVLTVS